MATSFEMANRAHNGGLTSRLGAMRSEGLSIEEMTERFVDDGYQVSRETVRRWCREAGIPTHRVPATAPTSEAS